jgi:PGDYG protein
VQRIDANSSNPVGNYERGVTEPLVFVSSGRPGYSPLISSDPRRIIARKLIRELQVEFAEVECTVQTPEGIVHARPGDAILTGAAGERWRVSRPRFAEKYQPVAPRTAGQPGRYVSLPIRILAIPMTEAFEVVLADGVSRLSGRPGDWLVDYGDGSLGVISRSAFAATYQIIG